MNFLYDCCPYCDSRIKHMVDFYMCEKCGEEWSIEEFEIKEEEKDE